MTVKIAPLFVLFAAILWGTTGTAQAFAPATAHPIAIGAARLAVGGLFLLLVTLLLGKLNLKSWPIGLTLLAAFCMACYQPLFFSAVHQTGVAVGTVIAIGSAPIFFWISRNDIFQKATKFYMVGSNIAVYLRLCAAVSDWRYSSD
ncbi:EamA family transporter [Terribacillus saccharophilus]|uniref:EamA family transporter n=1 Tax=Terribacillus saccharophilus TaxID=361277 RepID=UPI00345F6A53